jgi:hypothetical protein
MLFTIDRYSCLPSCGACLLAHAFIGPQRILLAPSLVVHLLYDAPQILAAIIETVEVAMIDVFIALGRDKASVHVSIFAGHGVAFCALAPMGAVGQRPTALSNVSNSAPLPD